MRQNAALILEHSTVIPFKSTNGYFTCFYCNKQHVAFDELKSHMTQDHVNMTFKSIVKCILRPQNPVTADISNITCRICTKQTENVDLLASHLKDEHNIKFNENKKPSDCILPYDLSDDKYKCCICKSEFMFFKTLSSHMNKHSSDYVCDICGRCFLLSERLKAHRLMHNEIEGKIKCETCDKELSSMFALKSHIRYYHKKIVSMCFICNEKFATSMLKVKHLKEVHNRTLDLDCKLCSKKYNTPRGLSAHMAIKHLKKPREYKHACNTCDMKFRFVHELKDHLVVHSGEKNYECEYCNKKYARPKTLKEHLKIHRNDRRWCCGACGQAFIQKCSLRNHIRVHHVDSDCEQLIVYQKPETKPS